jgi:DNA-binding LacI/PurR family transcriptional regulator
MHGGESKEPHRQRRATLKRVAEELGVSPMTVSNAYNRPGQLSPALRERVFETAQRLGYAGPDPIARGLRRGRTGALGVIYDSRLSYAFADTAAVAFMRGVSSAAEEERLGLLLVPGSSPEQRDAAIVGEVLVDGFVVYSVAEDDSLVRAALERGLPTVVVDQPAAEGVPFVGVDDRSSAAAAAEHLLRLGHRRFGVVSFGLGRDGAKGFADLERQRTTLYRVSRARLEGYAAALGTADVPWSEVPVFECPGSSRALGFEAAVTLLSLPSRPTALLAASDQLALGVMDAATDRGLSLPNDLSVVGFDDIPEAASADPPLTTIRQDHAEKGRMAGRLLIARLRGGSAESPELLTTELVVRGSTARPHDV